MIRSLLGGGMTQNLVAAMKGSGQDKAAGAWCSGVAKQDDSRKLKLAEAEVYGTTTMTLFGSGAIPNIMSTSL